jgi:hypothetical protein
MLSYIFVLKHNAFEIKYKEYAELAGLGRNQAGHIITYVGGNVLW